jgi:hypothetical protein
MQYVGMVSPKLRVCMERHHKQALYSQYHSRRLCLVEDVTK